MSHGRTVVPTLTDSNRCSGCGRCVAACHAKRYSLEPVGFRKLSISSSPDKCTGCHRCTSECPLGILSDGKLTF